MKKPHIKIFISIFEDILDSGNNMGEKELEGRYGEDKIQLFKELFCGGTEKFVRLMQGSGGKAVYFKLTKEGVDYLNTLKLSEFTKEQNKINQSQKKINYTILLAISIQALILFSTFAVDKGRPVLSDLLANSQLNAFSTIVYGMLSVIYAGMTLISITFLIFLMGLLFVMLWKNRENY